MRCVSINQSAEFAEEKGRAAFPCGKCVGCRVNNRRKWAARIALEAWEYPISGWVTLSYDKKHLPEDVGIHKQHLRDFLENLRTIRGGRWHRFFGVGEYGNETRRPHYHVILYGFVPKITTKMCEYDGKKVLRALDERVEEAWGNGGTFTDRLQGDAATVLRRSSYVARYTTKKLRSEEDQKKWAAWLGTRSDEFSIQSRRPGIGVAAVDRLAEAICSNRFETLPRTVRIAGRMYPLDRYMLDKLEEKTGLSRGYAQTSEPLSIEHLQKISRVQKKRHERHSQGETF